MYTLEVKTKKYSKLLQDFKFVGNSTYIYKGTKRECESLKMQLGMRGIDGSIYDDRYSRNYNARAIYFNSVPKSETYRCAYCGRVFPERNMTVDHIIPVRQAKRTMLAKFILKMMGCGSVNDLKNLTQSCGRCNESKGNKISLIYILRAKYGKSATYWKIVWTIRIVALVALISLLIMFILR